MKKRAQQSTVDVKAQELQGVINDALGQLNAQMEQATRQLNEQVTRSMQQIVTNLQTQIQEKLQEIKGQTITLTPDQMRGRATLDLPGVVRKGKKKAPKHPTPRGKEHTEDLPEFWRKNLDLGESPYLHIDKLETITDDVEKAVSKKRKGKGKKK